MTFGPLPLYVCLSTELQNSGEMDMESSCPIEILNPGHGERITCMDSERLRWRAGERCRPYLIMS